MYLALRRVFFSCNVRPGVGNVSYTVIIQINNKTEINRIVTPLINRHYVSSRIP